MSAVIRIEATRTRLFLVVVVVSVAFGAACFLERLLRDYLQTDIQPKIEPSDVTSSLPKWLNRNKDHFAAKTEARENGALNLELAAANPRRFMVLAAFVTPTVKALS
jgi:hypothetical protein